MRASAFAIALSTLLLVVPACAPTTAEGTLVEADAAMSRGNYGTARNLYQHYLSEYPSAPEHAKARFNIGKAHFESGNYTAAVRAFADVVRQHGDATEVWASLYYGGVAYARLGLCADATEWLGNLVEAAYTVKGPGGDEVRTFQARGQKMLDQVNDDMSGAHVVCPSEARD